MSQPGEGSIEESKEPTDGVSGGDSDRAVVELEQAEVREFVKQLSGDDIKSGTWFAKLLTYSVSTYADKVDWQYFQQKYRGLPPDAIVEQRIKMAARYAAIEGGLSASTYTTAVAATIGTAGGASPATVPAALTSLMVDVVYITQLQLRLAYDIAVLYRVPLDMEDPDDLWKLIRVAFTIKSGEFAREGVTRVVPALVRPLIKRYFRKGVLQTARGLPVVGKYLLQRNVIKVGIPAVGAPLAVVVNRYSTQVAGRHARAVFRNEARIVELAERLTRRTAHPRLMLWVAWAVVTADPGFSDDEALLLRHLVAMAEREHDVVDEELAQLVEIDFGDVLARLDAEQCDLTHLIEVARAVAEVDGKQTKNEQAVIAAITERCAGAF